MNPSNVSNAESCQSAKDDGRGFAVQICQPCFDQLEALANSDSVVDIQLCPSCFELASRILPASRTPDN